MTKEAFDRLDVGKFVMELNYIASKGTLEDRKVMWSYLQDVIRSEYLKVRSGEGKHSRGMRWSKDTKDLFATHKLMSGQVQNCSQRVNVGGP